MEQPYARIPDEEYLETVRQFSNEFTASIARHAFPAFYMLRVMIALQLGEDIALAGPEMRAIQQGILDSVPQPRVAPLGEGSPKPYIV